MSAYASPRAAPTAAHRAVGLWLLLCAVMVFAMAVIGAITRLTESGLSITEWQPILGALPPLSDGDWQKAFSLYQATPEYRLHNVGMSLEAFKGIYWWEWIHRNFGRLIGIVYGVGLLGFWAAGRIPRPLMPKLLGVLALGALQGVIGWVMVMSGLVDRPSVSHYKLALHLGLAVLLYTLLIGLALSLLDPTPKSSFDPDAPGIHGFAWACLTLVLVTVTWGAFVAGLDAGFAYNTFPLMNDHWLPPEADSLMPWWLNLFDNTAAVQFLHRWLGIGTLLMILGFAFTVQATDLPRSGLRIAVLLAVTALIQVGLGIVTLLFQVPVAVAATHQAGALTLIGLLVWMLHETRPPSSMAGE